MAIAFEKVKRIYNYRCAYCGVSGELQGLLPSMSESFLTPDHIVPQSIGGKNVSTNIQPLCWKCNSEKGCDTERTRQDLDVRLIMEFLS